MKERGFTIIEVSLFLAISGALILLTVGLWNMVARQRFQDTMVTLRTVIQSEYEEVRTNINERLGSTAMLDQNTCSDGVSSGDRTGNSQCLMIGKLIQFSGSSVKISYVVATDADQTFSNMSDETAIRSMNLKVVDTTLTKDAAILPRNVQIGWGGTFASGWTIPSTDNGPYSHTSTIAILHSPISGAILVFSLNGQIPAGITAIKNYPENTPTNQPVAILIKNGQVGFKGAALCIDSGASSTAVRTVIPADNYYNFNANSAIAISTNLRSMCGV